MSIVAEGCGVEPGLSFKIGNIPTAITTDHNEVYFYWQKSGMKDATLLHVDAHADMGNSYVLGKGRLKGVSAEEYYKYITVVGFITAAFHSGIISSIYWLNPHSQARRLQDMGVREFSPERLHMRSIGAYSSKLCAEEILVLIAYGGESRYANDYGKLVKDGQLIVPDEKPFLLDIDLDAFCCHRGVHDAAKGHKGVEGYEGRIQSTMEFLSRLGRKPDLITISRSAGQTFAERHPLRFDIGRLIDLDESHQFGTDGKLCTGSYVPTEHSTRVEELTLEGLRSIYC